MRQLDEAVVDLWESLTWETLDRWAGPRSVKRGRTYERTGSVRNLVVDERGRLLASVSGTLREPYVTLVEPRGEDDGANVVGKRDVPIVSRCSCPVGYDGCKHAVAVAAAFLRVLSDGGSVRTASARDPRWSKVALVDDSFDDGGQSEDGVSTEPAGGDVRVERFLDGLDRDGLLNLVKSLSQCVPEVQRTLVERAAGRDDDVVRLSADVLRELERLSQGEYHAGDWYGEHRHLPDFSRVRSRLVRMLELGYADEVVELGGTLAETGFWLVGWVHDHDGETGWAFAEALQPVFEALERSTAPTAKRLLSLVEIVERDDYGFLDDLPTSLLDTEHPAAVWDEVADELLARQRAEREPVRPSRWLLNALRESGRDAEIGALHEATAERTGDELPYVRWLIEQGETDLAEQRAVEALRRRETAEPRSRFHVHVHNLRRLLRQVAEQRGDWKVVAAHAALSFLERPSAGGYDELIEAARPARCVQRVRDVARAFLEDGTLPAKRSATGRGKHRTTTIEFTEDWPLPCPEYLRVLGDPTGTAPRRVARRCVGRGATAGGAAVVRRAREARVGVERARCRGGRRVAPRARPGDSRGATAWRPPTGERPCLPGGRRDASPHATIVRGPRAARRMAAVDRGTTSRVPSSSAVPGGTRSCRGPTDRRCRCAVDPGGRVLP